MFVGNYYALRLDSDLFQDFSIFGLKIRAFDEVYAYLIIQLAVVLPACVKKFILTAFAYQKLLHSEISKKMH